MRKNYKSNFSNLAGLTPPIDRSVSFEHDFLDATQRYVRCSHPVAVLLEQSLATLEGAGACRVTSSGMAAITAVIMAMLRPGETIITHTSAYSGTLRLITKLVQQWGIQHTAVDLSKPGALDQVKNSQSTLVWIESPCNPTLEVLPMRQLAADAKRLGMITVSDNTLCTPLGCNPLRVGVDIVVHSATKYLSGHGDVLAGAICSSSEIMARIEPWRVLLGGTLSADAAWMVLRGLSTLNMRYQTHRSNALELANFLRQHPRVSKVNYPGHADDVYFNAGCDEHPNGVGGLLSFQYLGDVHAFLDRLQHCSIALSFGEPGTIIAHPASMLTCADGVETLMPVASSLIRVAAGLEEICLVINDLTRAMEG